MAGELPGGGRPDDGHQRVFEGVKITLEGDDLEAREVLARAPPAALERRQRDVAHVRRIAEPQHDTVSDLAGELQHLAREAGQVEAADGGIKPIRHA